MRRSPVVATAIVAFLTLVALAGPSSPALARSDPHHAVGGAVVVTANVHHDVSPPLRDITPSTTPGRSHPALRDPNARPGPVVHAKDTSGMGSPRIPSPIANFDGISANGSAPPDTQGAAGSTQYMEMANTEIAVYSKTGSVLLSPRATNTIWSGFGGGCQTNNDGDGVVLWDWNAQRWVVSQFSVSTTPYLECVAVSQTSDATGSWYRYSFSPGSNFPDYPKMGVWPDGYYTTFNLFNSSGTVALGTEYCAYNRTPMLTGGASTQQCFTPYTSGEHTLLPASVQGSTLPPAGEPNYAVGLGTSANTLGSFKLHIDWTTPSNSSLTGPTNLAVTSFSQACGGGTCIPQSGTTQQLDSLGDRVMARLDYRNFGDHESLVVNHAVTSGSSVGERWYELRVGSGNSLSVYQQGTYAPDATYRWMGSIAQDQSGDIALGYSASSSSLHPGVRYSGRLPGDPLGQMPQGEGTFITGAGSQTGGLSRWGDYSSMTTDPADDCTFWFTSEYIPANGSFNWHTRIGSFKFSSCGGAPDFTISASPSTVTVTQGSSGNTTVSTTATGGFNSSISLSVSGLPSGATGAFSTNPIPAPGTGSSTLTISTSASTPTGTYTLTVTGTGGSVTHSTNVTLVVNAVPPNDFSISASPNTLTLTQGSSGTSTISTTITSGSSQSVSLSISGLPSGATGSFNPNPINSGSSSTLTVSTAASTPAGTYTLTVTGTGTSATHSTTITLTVNATGGSGITNGGFETGTFSGWTTTGPASISTTAPHSGTYAAVVGSSSPYSGDASAAQTFTAPTGATQISLWYKVVCPDTITYDWATATLTDNTGGGTVTLLAKTCTNNGTWKQATGSVVAGRSYTVKLISHDDNYPGDATYSYYDDVATSSVTNVVQNGGFETGTFSGWTTGGAFLPVIVSSGAHSGTYAARMGSTSPYNGDSNFQQTVTVPSSGGTLTFWYQPHCPDTITYDQETMQIRNTGGTVLATVLNVCSNSGAWTQVTYGMSAYAGQTVVLYFNNHDDNYPSDPTYTLIDDVSLQ